MSKSKTLTGFVIPLTIFPALLALGCKYMYLNQLYAGMDKAIEALCLPQLDNITSSITYLGKYTFIPSVDESNPGPCSLVAFLHLLLDSPTPMPREFLTYLVGTGLPCVLIPLIEAYRYRGKQHWLLEVPTFWLLLAQVITIGMTFPFYWLLLIFSRADFGSRLYERIESKKPEDTQPLLKQAESKTTSQDQMTTTVITPEEAEALGLGLILGSILPSAAMVLMNDTFATWIWQFYPAFVAFIRIAYSLCRSPKDRRKNNHDRSVGSATERSLKTLRTTYLGCFLLSTFVHIRMAWPLVLDGDLAALAGFLIPSLHAAGSSHPNLQAHNFLKWDYALGYSCVVLGLFWSAKSLRQIAAMSVWYALAVPLFGMGGAVMGVLAWRDVV